MRSDAANRVEAYLYKGPLWPGALNENHIKGMRAISVIQRVNTRCRLTARRFALVQDEGYQQAKSNTSGSSVWMPSKPFTDGQELCALDRDDELVQRSALRL